MRKWLSISACVLLLVAGVDAQAAHNKEPTPLPQPQNASPTPTGTPGPMLATITSITIEPQNPSIKEGDTVQLTVTGHLSDGSTQSNVPVEWMTSDAGVAAVSNVAGMSAQPKHLKAAKVVPAKGMILGMGGGTATIGARYGDMTASTKVTVEALPTPTPTETTTPSPSPSPTPLVLTPPAMMPLAPSSQFTPAPMSKQR